MCNFIQLQMRKNENHSKQFKVNLENSLKILAQTATKKTKTTKTNKNIQLRPMETF